MLTNLHVKNLALIDEAEVEFGPGLNILTGETGAGKSILIGSINAALGKKISREMIRTGETSALVELVFETENPHVLELLKETDLGAEEGQVIISRKITGSRSVCRINGEACNISQVKALASLLLDIHGQHEHQSLLYPDRQIAILDAFARIAAPNLGRCVLQNRIAASAVLFWYFCELQLADIPRNRRLRYGKAALLQLLCQLLLCFNVILVN